MDTLNYFSFLKDWYFSINTKVKAITGDTIKGWFGWLLSPPRCAYCKLLLHKYAVFCVRCDQKIVPIISTSVTLSSVYSMNVFAVSDYQEPVRSLIVAKNRGDIVASRQLGELIRDKTPLFYAKIDYLIPIPLHWARQAHRGYNQAEEMAHVLAKRMNKPVVRALKRVKRTAFQYTLTQEERVHNVKEAFVLVGDGAQYYNKHLVLVDDLMTTSVTVQAAAKVLMQYKPASINVIVACRVV